eukprot:6083820-Lingulodinium_polyedra.AAC.1
MAKPIEEAPRARAWPGQVPGRSSPARQSAQPAARDGEVEPAQGDTVAEGAERAAERAAPSNGAVAPVVKDSASRRPKKGKAKQPPGARNWCFTATPVSADALSALASWSQSAQVKYVVFGWAVCQGTQKPFLTGYVEFCRKFRKTEVMKRPAPNSW